ncbi:MAG: SBBP repeat-containing protein, partial [Deltaproteobacteria bacterium]|nr:SBBP repeat-containing protein [Deltaproteobacteria bacterium]
GQTDSTEATFPVTVGPDLTHNGGADAYVAKVDASGTALAYCGYIGGSGADFGYGIAVDGAGGAYVTGQTDSTEATFPVAAGPDLTYNGNTDVFVARIIPYAVNFSDPDGDTVPNSEEQGPDGNNPNYDGNGDGTPDCQQNNVASFHAYDQAGGRHYITLAIPSDQRIEYVYVPRAFADPPPEGVSFPYGLFSFTLGGLPVGGATTMTIYLDGPPPQTYYKYGRTPDNQTDHWYEFAYDGKTGSEVVGNTVVLHFMDGRRGDHDLEENGRIVDPGGPAQIAPHAGLYFPYLVSTSDEQTEIGIINTKSYASTSAISYYGGNGDFIKTDTITLGPHGKVTISSDGIPQNSASAIISGDGDPVGYTRYVNASGKRCAWSAGTSLQKSLFVPHTAVDANWTTALGLFNPNDEAVEVTLEYESGGSTTFTLNAKSRRFLRLTEAEAVVSITSTGYFSGMEMFDSLASGGDISAILLSERSLNALYVPSSLHGSGEFTGIGLKSHYNGTVHVTGHSAIGETEEISFGTQPLDTQASQSRVVFNLSGMLGDENLWAKISGEADFSTPFGTPLLHFQGLAVYGKENTVKLGAVHLNALRFREGFIGILANDPETTLVLLNPNTEQSTVALLNPNTEETTITVTGFNAAGEILANHTVRIAAESNWTGTASDLINGVSVADMTHIRMVSDIDLYGFETISSYGRMEMLPVMGIE